jgi:hypothetical protein
MGHELGDPVGVDESAREEGRDERDERADGERSSSKVVHA